MGNQQSRWKLEKMFGIRRYIRLGSSSQIEPLLGAEGRVETKYQLFTDDHNHKADIETIHKRNSVLERKVDDLTRKVNDLLSRNSKGMEFSATCLTSQIILSEPKDIICPEGSNSSDELAAGMIILIFLISFLIGMQIPTFT